MSWPGQTAAPPGITALGMETMHLLRDDMLATGRRGLLWAAVLAVAAGLVFDWSPVWAAVGVAAGTLGFGAFDYLREVGTRVPDGELPPAPAQATWRPRERWFWSVIELVVSAAALGALVWVLGQEESAFFGALLIGRFAGEGVAHLVGARQVARWEKRSGLRVAFSGEDDDERRFGVHPVGLLDRP